MSNEQQPTTVVIPSSPADRAEILQFLNSASDSMVRIEAEREHIKGICADLKEKFAIPLTFSRKMIKLHHESNMAEVEHQHNDLIDLYSAVSGNSVDEPAAE
jgi:hypothetical protein